MKQYLYKFLFLIISFCYMIQPAWSKDIRFVQITDLHYRNDAGSVLLLDKMIDDINALKRVEFVVFTGDNTHQANEEVITKFLVQAQRLNVPYYVIVGNHDLFKSAGIDRAEYAKLVRKYNKNQKARKTNFKFENNGILFVALDGVREVIPSPGGYYRNDTLKWLDKTLKDNKDKNVVILQHFPLKLRNTERDVYKIERYFDVLNRHENVIGIFSGHFHANEEYIQDGVFHSITGRASGPDAGYKIVDMVEEKNLKTKKKLYTFYTQMVTYE